MSFFLRCVVLVYLSDVWGVGVRGGVYQSAGLLVVLVVVAAVCIASGVG